MRKRTVAISTLVTVLFLTGLFTDIHSIQHFASVTIKDWTNALGSTNKMYLQTHSADGRTTEPNKHTKDHTIYLKDAKNNAVILTSAKGRAISHTDIWGHENKPTSLACRHNSSFSPLDDETRKTFEIHDLFRKTPAFLANYKNPCWKQDNSSTLVCLPYFYLAGFPKCGTTFTFDTTVGHPEAVKGVEKEPHWIAKKRFKDGSDFQSYLNVFAPAARVIESKASTDPSTGQKFHPIITGDGSASTAWENRNWRYLPGNYNCTEPRVVNPHYVYHINPSTKVIILVRNPTDRTFSAYNYFTKGNIMAESFHAAIVHELRTLKDCCSKYSMRVCAYDHSSKVRGGLYHVFIRDWLKVFPADQILISRLEDIHADPYRAFTRIFDFLDLSHLSRSELKKIINKSRMNHKRKRFQAKNETRRLLDDFYRPHNIQLARLLQQHDPTSYSSIDDAMYSH